MKMNYGIVYFMVQDKVVLQKLKLGIPVDLKLLNEFNVWWPHVKADVMIRSMQR